MNGAHANEQAPKNQLDQATINSIVAASYLADHTSKEAMLHHRLKRATSESENSASTSALKRAGSNSSNISTDEMSINALAPLENVCFLYLLFFLQLD